MGSDESLDDLNNLTDLVGSDLGMVSNPSVAQPVKNVPTSVSTSTTSNNASDMPSDISDLRSSDLLQSLSGVDIDRMFADFQAEANREHHEVRLHTIFSVLNYVLRTGQILKKKKINFASSWSEKWQMVLIDLRKWPFSRDFKVRKKIEFQN